MTLATYDTASRSTGSVTALHSVLVCDDEELVRWSLTEHLRGEGYNVTAAKNGLECIEATARSVPDVILLDLKMPVLDGLEAAREIRRREANRSTARVPIIALSAETSAQGEQATLRAGMDMFLSKPVSLDLLTATIAEALTRSRGVA